MKNIFSLITVLASFALYAQERNAPEGSHEVNSWTAPSFSGSNFIGGANLNGLKNSLGASSELLQRDKFNSTLEVNTNRGSLSVDFSLPLPSNLLGKKSLSFEYNHRQKQNLGFGVGLNLLLPNIQKSIDGTLRFNSAKYIKVECSHTLYTCYKASLENDFSIIYETDEKNYIFFSRGGKHILFDSDGRISSEYDNYKNKIHYHWDGAKLVKISDEKQKWEVLFNYTGEQNIPIFVGNKLFKLPNKLESISFKKENKIKRAIFSYQEEYLTNVKWEKGKKDIFRASYEAVLPEVEETFIKELEEDEIYITQEDPNSVVIKNTKDEKNISLYLDLNNDYRLDKFEFNSKSFKDKVEGYLRKLEYDVRGGSIENCEARPKKAILQVQQELSKLEAQLDFYWAKVTENKNFEYIKDKRLSGMNFAPSTFQVVEKKTKNDNCHNVFYYSVEKIIFKKPVLLSQNTEDEKILVWITPDIEDKGNLAKKLFKFLESGKISSSQRVESEVWALITDKEKLSRLYPKFGTSKENVVPEVRNFEKRPSLVVTKDAIVFDFNYDGLDDIFEGDRVLLQKNDGGFESFDLSIADLNTRFELDRKKEGDKFFLINSGEKIKVAKGNNSFSLRDYDLIDSKKLKPGSNKKLLKSYETPFGGKFEIEYLNQNKTQLVSKIIKKDDSKVHHEREFTYTGSMFDFYTGVFIGYEKTFEKVKSGATQDQKIIERNFLADAYPSVVLFEQRARLQGRIFSEIHSTTSLGKNLKKTWSWDGVELDSNRIYPYTIETTLERLNGQDKTIEILRNQSEIIEWEGFDFIKAKKVSTSSFNDLVPAHHGGELKEVVSHYVLNDAGLVLLDSKENRFRNKTQIQTYLYNEEGKLIQETLNKKTQNYEYDKFGRVVRVADYRGLVTELEYSDLSLEPFSIISGDESVWIKRDGVFSLPQTQTFFGKEYAFSYNDDLENIAIDLIKKDRKTRIFEKNEFQKYNDYLIPKYRLSIQDKNFDINLDQFGSPIKVVEDFQGKKRVVFDNEVVDDLVLKSRAGYFEKDISFFNTSYSYNAKGEKLTSKHQSLEGTLHYINKYLDGCHTTELNGKEISAVCKNLLNQIFSSSFLDENSHFSWAGDGVLDAVNDSHAWATNSDSELIGFKFEDDDFSQDISEDTKTISSGNKTIKLDEKGRERELHLGEKSVFQTYQNGLLISLKMTDSSKEIYEEVYSYEFGNLKNINSKKFQKEFEYDEFERVVKEKTSVSKTKLSLDYQYANGEITNVKPFVKNVSYDGQLRITSIQYENGLVANLTYYKDTEVVRAVQYTNDNKLIYADNSAFNELAQLLSHNVLAPEWGRKINSSHIYKNFVLQNAIKKKKFLEKQDNLSHCGEYVCRDREFELFYTSSLGLKLGRSQVTGEEFVFINSHEVIVKDKLIKLVELKGLPFGVIINDEFYPVIIGHKKEILGLVNSNGDELLFLRAFDLYGNKELVVNDNAERAQELDNLVVWSFGRLRHNPLEEGISKSLYFSLSRAYSTQTGQWTSVDPLVAWGPQALVSNPGNWNPYSYCNGDPVNCVDPSGYYGVFGGLAIVGGINAIAMSGGWGATKLGMILGGVNTPANNVQLNQGMLVGLSAGFAPAMVYGGGQAIVGIGKLVSNRIYTPMMYSLNVAIVSNPQRFELTLNNTIDFLDSFSGSLGGPTTGIPSNTYAGIAGWGVGFLMNPDSYNMKEHRENYAKVTELQFSEKYMEKVSFGNWEF